MLSSIQLLQTLNTYPNTQRLWIAYSGGMDSHVLLHSLAALRARQAIPALQAVHVQHGLNPQAEQWVTHCQQVCADLAVPLTILRIKVQPQARESLEACARNARYAALAQQLTAGDIILTAHHADDQAETLLLQLLRGAGVAGLAAMPALNRFECGWLARPLLNHSHAELQHYAQQHALHWVEDDSNQNTRFERNFLRHAVLPIVQQHWQQFNHTLVRAAQHQAEAQQLLNELAAQDLVTVQQTLPTLFQTLEALNIEQLNHYSAARQRNLLRYWLKQQQLAMPSTAQLAQILTQLCQAAPDRQPLVQWADAEARRYRHYLVAMPQSAAVVTDFCCIWQDLTQPLQLPVGCLQARLVTGQGLNLEKLASPLQVRYRQGGEHWQWRGQQRSLKKCLQNLAVLPWQRSRLPLLYQADTLVAVPAVGVHDAYRTHTDEQGWLFDWQLDEMS